MKIRGFEKISSYKEMDFPLPSRQTARSAGYDIYLPETVTIPAHGQKMVPTGVKAYMQDNEYLGIHIRSSMAVKRHLRLVNNEGIVDADYYNNPDNEGEIFAQVMNITKMPVEIHKGDRICQAIFHKYLLADDDEPGGQRQGGFGSTGDA